MRLGVAPSPAQENGPAAINGVVLDQVGKSIAGASVIVKSDSTGAPRTLTTDPDGRFAASGFSVGTYIVEAVAPGFGKTARSDIRAAAG